MPGLHQEPDNDSISWRAVMGPGHSRQELRRWDPLPTTLPAVLYCESLADTEKGLEIVLSSEDRESGVRLTFENPVAYQNVNETYRGRTWVESPSRLSTLHIV